MRESSGRAAGRSGDGFIVEGKRRSGLPLAGAPGMRDQIRAATRATAERSMTVSTSLLAKRSTRPSVTCASSERGGGTMGSARVPHDAQRAERLEDALGVDPVGVVADQQAAGGDVGLHRQDACLAGEVLTGGACLAVVAPQGGGANPQAAGQMMKVGGHPNSLKSSGIGIGAITADANDNHVTRGAGGRGRRRTEGAALQIPRQAAPGLASMLEGVCEAPMEPASGSIDPVLG